ncbi:MAG: hypothetical protein NZ601_01305 [candidate division WOR-3 bacterium]|nr:hypothetical protein [candidate division WOR-3 bacterium]MCX7757962.1 hypothetical protein [candidate division WOR-3 bacterium]MDW7987309.1 hypothetical protein [candidate division WOR-3 bacterium]
MRISGARILERLSNELVNKDLSCSGFEKIAIKQFKYLMINIIPIVNKVKTTKYGQYSFNLACMIYSAAATTTA